MPVYSARKEELKLALSRRLQAARDMTDSLFALIRPEALLARPVRERHRIIFYIGHLEVFDWNMIGRHGFGLESPDPRYDRLFGFGIDPVNGGLPEDAAGDWPPMSEIRRRNARIRSSVDDCLQRADDLQMFLVGIEHRLMHAETVTYMMHWLDYALKTPPAPAPVVDTPPRLPRRVDIPAGEATLGFTQELQEPFGWDNEFQPQTVSARPFAIDVDNVTNAQYLEFVEAGGYEHPSLKWFVEAEGINHPKFWRRRKGTWWYRAMFGEIPLPLAWPVYVSHAEAAAYARWAGRALPTEVQFHRAAFGAPGGRERLYPWGNAAPEAKHGNFNFLDWNPSPVGTHPAGDSAFGVADLVGNGWEWTSTMFEPFPGFKPFSFYPGYSANFFDGSHYVLKGASPRTASALLRRSFRNWFQPHYPNIYATFRCVDN